MLGLDIHVEELYGEEKLDDSHFYAEGNKRFTPTKLVYTVS